MLPIYASYPLDSSLFVRSVNFLRVKLNSLPVAKRRETPYKVEAQDEDFIALAAGELGRFAPRNPKH